MEGEEATVICILLWFLWFCDCPSALAFAESAESHWRAEITTQGVPGDRMTWTVHVGTVHKHYRSSEIREDVMG